MDAPTVLLRVQDMLRAQGKLLLSSSHGPRPWTIEAPAKISGDEIICDLSGQQLPFRAGRQRVSFFTGPDAYGGTARGSGILNMHDRNGLAAVTAYRLSLTDLSSGPAAEAIIEQRQNSWRIKPEREPQTYSARFWYRAVRGVSLPLSVCPILIGTALALGRGPVHWAIFGLALAGGVAAHLATNLVSDYFDFVKGVDTTNALSSHTGVLVDELIAPDRLLIAAAALFTLTAFCGGVLTVTVGWPVLAFGLAGIVGGFSYTGGPAAAKYLGIGEFSTGFLMGPLMVLGAYFVQTRALSSAAILLSIAVGLLVSAVSLANNIRDAFFDQKAGIVTMPVKLGARGACYLFDAMILVPFVLAAITPLLDRRLVPVLLALVVLPSIVPTLRDMHRHSREFSLLSDTAARLILPLRVIRLHLRFSVLVLAGCLISWARSFF